MRELVDAPLPARSASTSQVSAITEESRAELGLITQDNRQPKPAPVCPLSPDQLASVALDSLAPCADNGVGYYQQLREKVRELLN